MELSILIAAGIAALAAVYTAVTQATSHTRNGKAGRLFIDTSVLIDGRIIEVAQSGFISDVLAIPRSVVGELQLLADKGDSDKRAKARHGLDVITQLQALESVEVELFADSPQVPEGVDSRLVTLARQHGGKICTVDFNLNKVAVVEGITVCNVNELAKNLRMTYLPGEVAPLHLTDTGQDRHQAVGHLDDGTMVVVEQASKYVGKTVDVEFIRGLQTDAGRMMFARLYTAKSAPSRSPKSAPAPNSNNSNGNSKQTAKPARKKPQADTKSTHQSYQRQGNSGQSKSRPHKASRNKRQTNEDRLVDLANQ